MNVIKRILLVAITLALFTGCEDSADDDVPDDFFERDKAGGDNQGDNSTDGGDTNLGGGDGIDNDDVVIEKTPEQEFVEAVKKGEIELVQKTLADKTEYLDLKSDNGENLLIIATQFNHWALVKYFFDAGISPYDTDKRGKGAIDYATEKGQDLIVELFNKGSIEQAKLDQEFLNAVDTAKLDQIQFFIDIGANKDAKRGRNTAFTIAVPKGQKPVIELLIRLDVSLIVQGTLRVSDWTKQYHPSVPEEIVKMLEDAETAQLGAGS
ncbi:ankyrin repeat domain-containing protein [Pseudobacteriovorax antillogorgiicola]|uniref:Uncharacterized protein n=1 Tax=Pseudobacteriovorax antillogorgiicola TaxID=1513793 RepID=A0A1Y6CCJ1_9BACT|nr:ankyrin repeat domain-containing protein [Pseudobacteriovorax antillogorgiicola]TCS48712.1 hypothetical protein EDD56_117134 [Pseudobacteriovorax antillogorgiicola]SMF54611.1 hypothetical protein SAMN06296036_11725 [Pseudobacteriovorax antillogorgiicola]